ncbi:MAG: SDR family NAD(P)-dependent oxidoreductase [Pseudomonadota bacterium]
MARRALVTGGNRGIGFAVVEGLRDAGLEVVIAARDAGQGADAAAKLGVDSVALDLMRPETFPDALAQAGDIDVLVNNAGVLIETSMIDDPDGWAQSMQVMVHAPYELIRLLAPGMGARGYGRIVNVSSGWGAFAEGLGGPGTYGVAKASLNALTKALPRDLPPNVKVNAMCPGWVRTRMGGAAASLSPKEGADTAIWLATLPDNGPTGGFFRRRKPIAW